MVPLLAWGVVAGGALGAARTREAALHLLEKNRALLELGVPALPGNGHLGTLASWAPAGAGAVFFGLSLGLGGAALVGLARTGLRALPSRAGLVAPWALLALPLAAAAAGDAGLAAFLAALVLGALVFAPDPPPPRTLLLRIGAAAVAALGLLPWTTTPEGPFTRFRDRVLLSSPGGPGLVANELYYRWTLYPAEALKPLDARTQPTVEADLPGPAREAFCSDAARLGLVCLPPGAGGADCRATRAEGAVILAAGSARVVWPGSPGAQQEAWRRLAASADGARALRRATAAGLFWGWPAALLWSLSGLALALSGWVPRGPSRVAAALVCAALLGGLVGAVSLPPPWMKALRAALGPAGRPDPGTLEVHLQGERPVERLYAVRAARRLGPRGEPWLIDALSDPVINVRYEAASGLGATGGPRAREVLVQILESPEPWYVKERAYAGLRRLGWSPRERR